MADTQSEVARRYTEWMTAVQRRDFITLERVLAPEFVYTDNGIGRQTRAQWFDAVRAYDLEQFAFRTIEVTPYDDIAVAIVTYEQTARRNGEPRSGSFLITDVWHRADGGWQVIARSSILKQPFPSENSSTGCAGFGNVDRSGDPRRLMDYLRNVTDHPLLVAWRTERMKLARVAQGERVLDIGCGIGIETLALAKAVAPKGGKAVGVDLSAQMLTEARRLAAGVDNVQFEQADVAVRLPFEDGHFDLAWSSRVLLFVEDPVRAAREVRRVLRTDGGRWVAAEPYFPGLMVDAPDDPELERLLRDRQIGKQPRPGVALSLLRIAREAGFTRARAEPTLLVWPNVAFADLVLSWKTHLDAMVDERVLDRSRADKFLAAREADEAAGRFFMVLPIVTVISEG